MVEHGRTKSGTLPYLKLCLFLLASIAAVGCSLNFSSLLVGTDTPSPSPQVPTETPRPTQTPVPTSPPTSPTPSLTPLLPGDRLVPTGSITPPPDGYQLRRPTPPDVASESHTGWVREYVSLVTNMLNSDQTPQDVLNTLIDWSSPGTDGGERTETAAWFETTDLDGDGTAEWLFSLPVPERGCMMVSCPAYMVIFETQDDLFHPRYVIRGGAPHELQMQQPQLLRVEDLNADGLREILLQQRWCGAHTCNTGLTVGRWDGSAWRDLAAHPINQASTELTIEDRDGDGVMEFSLHGGTYGSVGAGLQRPHRLVFDWVEGAYRQVEDIPDPSDHPYYLMLDANRALAEDRGEQALSLAERALNNPNFENTNFPVEDVDRRRIITYAAVEVMLVQAQRGDVTAMEAALDQARSYGFFAPNAYSEAADRLLEVYQNTKDVMAACSAVEELIARQPQEAVFFQQYGYNTERMTVGQICPLDPADEGESPQL